MRASPKINSSRRLHLVRFEVALLLPAGTGAQEGTPLSARSSHRCVAVGERLVFLGGTLQDRTCNQNNGSGLRTLRLG